MWQWWLGGVAICPCCNAGSVAARFSLQWLLVCISVVHACSTGWLLRPGLTDQWWGRARCVLLHPVTMCLALPDLLASYVLQLRAGTFVVPRLSQCAAGFTAWCSSSSKGSSATGLLLQHQPVYRPQVYSATAPVLRVCHRSACAGMG